jgi:hypothetical protein
MGPPDAGDAEVDRVASRLRQAGVPVVEWFVDPADVRAFVRDAEYAIRYPGYYEANQAEKTLEHYLAAQLLSLAEGQVYLDVASEGSPAPEIYSRLWGVDPWRQDLSYEPGVRGQSVGSDAAAIPLPDAFADRMALHCSFEHFEGDADVRFVAEAERLLRPGGALCIVPLYCAETYSVMTDPAVAAAAGVAFEADATVCCVPGWGNRHGRFYDSDHLVARVLSPLHELAPTVYRIRGAGGFHPSCYARMALVLRKPWRPPSAEP